MFRNFKQINTGQTVKKQLGVRSAAEAVTQTCATARLVSECRFLYVQEKSRRSQGSPELVQSAVVSHQTHCDASPFGTSVIADTKITSVVHRETVSVTGTILVSYLMSLENRILRQRYDDGIGSTDALTGVCADDWRIWRG